MFVPKLHGGILKILLADIWENSYLYKQLPSREANAEKLESSNFLPTTVKENKDSFVKFDKETDCFDTFIWHFFLDHFFIMLQEVLKMLMILSHGQATVAKGDLVLMVNFWLKIFTRKV